MGLPISFSKQLAASSATNIATSQSPTTSPITLNGSTVSGAGQVPLIGGLGTITAGSGYVPGNYRNVKATGGSGSGLVFGSIQVGASGTVIAVSMIGGSPGSAYAVADSLSASNTQLGGTGSGFAVAVATVTGQFGAVATLDTQRRVLITSGGNDSGINFTVTGTNDYGNVISDTFAGANVGAAQSNLDFKTVTSVTHTGSVAGTVTVGTNGVGSTPWFGLNWHAQPFNVSLAGIVLAGATVNYSYEYTYDDPNSVAVPYIWTHPTLGSKAASADGTLNDPVVAVRLTVNSGTGLVRGVIEQAGLSGQ